MAKRPHMRGEPHIQAHVPKPAEHAWPHDRRGIGHIVFGPNLGPAVREEARQLAIRHRIKP
ncbi:hypothetical protein AB4Y87_25590 [Paenarthrobacter sp. RAF54_2]|uniref:hypothetical protein n=1 Tax=Paenarthrobacter sp. RAF54_2 TaxID=3233061 RepID=UPI003F9A7774